MPGIRLLRRAAIACAAAVLASTVAAVPAAAADNPYERGPNPTRESVAASRGTFATAETSVGGGNGFAAAKIYYPTDTSQGKFGAIAVVPGYTATWAAEGAWMGHWPASFGFVVIGIDTLSRNDWDVARGTQLLAALDYLTQRSSVRDRVDATRLAVMGHSMGGGGAISAALRRPSLKTAIGNAPFSASQNLNNMQIPTALLAGQRDGTTTPSSISGYYNQIPAGVEKMYLELTGAGHGFPTSNNPVMTRKVIPWMKIFIDNDTRYHQFLCPLMDNTGISAYRSTCPLIPVTRRLPRTPTAWWAPPLASARTSRACPRRTAPGCSCGPATVRSTSGGPGRPPVSCVSTTTRSAWTRALPLRARG
ncbi:dienelactone hydrolase family protein [Lentzea atacamensis]|uniref:Dienelactone hydrolase family protein n=1 Tax=Lentzea atacamensis TaxID=531938 RepID=A0ABX9EKW1_9PSEU|nr:dienelactone hydrolase family protein [Lentzea atacamensis]